MNFRVVLSLTAFLIVVPAQAFDLSEYGMVDLSHTYDENTLFWPTSPSHFDKTTLSYGQSDGGWFYSSFSVCTPEHGGTHLDAPRHFSETGHTTEAIPLEQLITPLVVIDVSVQAKEDRDYRLSRADVAAFEEQHGKIAAGSTVLLRSNWSAFWPDALGYLGDDTAGDASNLHFPGFDAEAARLLVQQRMVAALGVDTASIDYGQSKDFMVHRVAAAGNVIGLENLTGLSALPATGAILIAMPMKIGGGSGGPARVIALVPKVAKAGVPRH